MAVAIKVSVVVPVFQPGPYLEPCVASLLGQSLPAEELELIFVDDASEDGTFESLQQLAVLHPQVQAITIPRSGWPGKPRNIGTAAATGEYVMYVDQDDQLEPEALQRMYDLGAANDADIVLGKVTSDFRGVHQYLYREQRPRCTVYDSRLINSQTPHKMLRRQFMLDHELWFPEGRRRLEDQLFITRAYFAARSCSILADYVCYRYLRRTDGGNAGSQRIEPEQYYANLREVLDVIDAAVEPGQLRDQFYRRFLRVELLGKLSGRRVRAYPPEIGDEWVDSIRTLLEERFPVSVDDQLPGLARTRAHLARHATFADLLDLTERTRRVHPVVSVTDVTRGTAGGAGKGKVQLQIDGRYEIDGRPLVLEPDPSGGWLLPTSLTGDLAPQFRRIEETAKMTADVVIVERTRGDEWFLTPSLQFFIEPGAAGGELWIRGVVVLDPATVQAGRPLAPGTYDVLLRVEAMGLSRLRRIGWPHDPEEIPAAGGVVSRAPRTTLTATRSGRLTITAGLTSRAVRRRLAPAQTEWAVDRFQVRLRRSWWVTGRLSATFTGRSGTATQHELRPVDSTRRLWVSAVDPVPPGDYDVRLQLKGNGSVSAGDSITLPRSLAWWQRAARRRARKVRRRARSAQHSLARRLRLRS